MEFHGFQNTLPSILIFLLSIGLILLAWSSYNKHKSISKPARWTLITLRSFAFIIVLILLFNPYFFSSQEVETTPEIAIFFDNSESTTIKKSTYNGLETYQDFLQDLNVDNISDVTFDIFSFGEIVQSSEFDSLDGTESNTNLSAPVQAVLEMNADMKAAILITDGIITYGRNPVINSFNSSIPIYTIGIGDTSYVNDIAISDVTTNTTGYTNTNHIIETDITQTGFEGSTINLKLMRGEEVLGEQRVTFDTNDQTKSASFDVLLKEPGLKQYKLIFDPLQGEWSQENNTATVSVDVIDSRIRILHAAFAIHPDVKAIRALIESDHNNILYSLTSLGSDRYVEEMPDIDQSEIDLIILHGYSDSEIQTQLLSDLTNVPTLFMDLGTSNSVRSDINNWSSYRLINSSVIPAFATQLDQAMNSSQHSIMELPEIDLDDIPSLYSPRRSTINDPRAETLFQLVNNGINTSYPSITVLELGNVRRGHVLPWGWYRMALSSDPTVREYYQSLFTNIISWISNNPDDRLLRVVPEKRIIDSSMNPVLNGFVRNERGEPESDAIVEVQIEGNNSISRTFNMDNQGDGNFKLELPKLSQGLYTYNASARKSGRLIESLEGEFLVSNTSNELSDTDRNDALLRSIASNSGGSYYVYNDMEGFWDELREKNILSKGSTVIENYIFPVRSIYWFLLLITILGSEWFLRKYHSLP